MTRALGFIGLCFFGRFERFLKINFSKTFFLIVDTNNVVLFYMLSMV